MSGPWRDGNADSDPDIPEQGPHAKERQQGHSNLLETLDIFTTHLRDRDLRMQAQVTEGIKLIQ